MTSSYDLVGNRLTQTSTLPDIAAQNETYSDNDWLDGTIYDDNGNTTLEDGNTDVYDFMNRLVRRTTSGGSVIDITYDADGNRITKSASAGVTHYLVDMNNLTGYAQVLEELDSTLTTERVYTYGLDLIAQHQLMPVDAPTGWETSYYLYDGLGTVRALADENGLISDAYTYDAWGNLINTQGLTPNSYLFTGEQWDHDLGMYFLRARYMNTETGRFHTLDTFEGRNVDPQTLHKYLYAHGNPVFGFDPSGYQAVSINDMAIGVAIAGSLALLAVPSFLDSLHHVGESLITWAVGAAVDGVTSAITTAVLLAHAFVHSTSQAIKNAAEKLKKQLRRIRCKGRLLFHYTDPASAVAIGASRVLRPSRGFGAGFPAGAYASDIWPIDFTYTQRTLSMGFYGHPGRDVSAFVAFCSRRFTPAPGGGIGRVTHYVARSKTLVPIDVKLAGPNLMPPR